MQAGQPSSPHSPADHPAPIPAAGADFGLVAPEHAYLRSAKPVVAVCAVRTGCGKSQTSRYVIDALKKRGKKCVLVRHPMVSQQGKAGGASTMCAPPTSSQNCWLCPKPCHCSPPLLLAAVWQPCGAGGATV